MIFFQSQSNKILHQTIQAIHTGNVSSEICDSLQSALRMPNFEVTTGANGNITRNGSDDHPSTTPPT